MSFHQFKRSTDSYPVQSGDREGEVKSENIALPYSAHSENLESESKKTQTNNEEKEETSVVLANYWVDLDRSHLHDKEYWRKIQEEVHKIPEKLEAPAAINFMSSYFMPYLGEPDPTYRMIFKTEDNSKYTKQQDVLPFTPKYSPEDHFIHFALEVATYIYKFQNSGGISRSQYASMLSPHFADGVWDSMKFRKPNEMLMAYATTCYHWKQRRHDFRGYEQLPVEYRCGEKRTHQRDLIYAYSEFPRGELSLFMYEAPMEVVIKLLQRFSYVFNPAGFPIHLETVDVREIIRDAIMPLAIACSKPPLSFVPLYRKRDSSSGTREGTYKREYSETLSCTPEKKRSALPVSMQNISYSSKEWYKGEPKTECIKLWRRIPNVPRRTFQSFVNPSTWAPPERKEIDKETEFRARHNLCSFCGNHLASNTSSEGHRPHPFYEMFGTRQSLLRPYRKRDKY